LTVKLLIFPYTCSACACVQACVCACACVWCVCLHMRACVCVCVYISVCIIQYYYRDHGGLGFLAPKYHPKTIYFVTSRQDWLDMASPKMSSDQPSASTALAQVPHRSHSACTVNCHLCGSGERNGAQRRTKVSFMMQALELLRLAKRHISGQSNIEQCKNQIYSLSAYRVTLV